MNELEKSDDNVIGRDIVNIDVQDEPEESSPNLLAGVFRRWHIIFLTFLVVCAAGLPAIWLLKKPMYNVEGAIRIASVMADILNNRQDKGEISDYEVFMNTQAALFTSDQVLQRVADELHDKDLSFFQRSSFGLIPKIKQKILDQQVNPDILWLLKQAISKGYISVRPVKNTEFIQILVKSPKQSDAQQIVDSFINNVMILGRTTSIEDEDLNLSLLESEKKDLESKISNTSQSIYRLAQEYGTDTLSGRQEMMIQRIAALQAELIRTQATKASAEIEVSLLERQEGGTIPPDELLKMRQQYVNNDISVVTLMRNIADIDQKQIIAEQTLTPIHPDINLYSDLLETMNSRLEERKKKAGEEFEKLLALEMETAGDSDLIEARIRFEHIKGTEQLLKEEINKEDKESIKLGQMQLEISGLQDELELYKKNYDVVLQRIREQQFNQKRPARMSILYGAQLASVTDKRVKFSAALVMAGLFAGAWFAFLRDKADKKLRTPDDAAKRIGIRIIGTTTSMQAVKSSLLPEQIIDDYQTIRANLELINGHGIPEILVVTSPSMREGKTTFSVNLATSLAQAGKKVLLIDGDLRKPDVARLLNLPKGTKGLQEVLSGIQFERAIYSLSDSNLDILAADFYDNTDAYELLALDETTERIRSISERYDHVIIDTPPVLAFPDALLWAKMANAVLLTSLAGQTSLPELKEAKERLLQINAKVLGTVVGSVEAEDRYYHRSSAYYVQSAKARRARRKTLLSFEKK